MLPVYAVLASGAWLFISGAVIFAVALPKWFQTHFGHITRESKDLPLWAVALEKLLQALGLVLLVLWTTQSILVLCAVPLLLVTATYLLSTYANYRVKGGPVVVIAILDALRLAVALVIAGLLLGRALF